jgi:type I restriction enzyme R subunit
MILQTHPEVKAEQDSSYKPLTVATIFSYAANEAQDAIGDINDESIDTSEMNPAPVSFWNLPSLTITPPLK